MTETLLVKQPVVARPPRPAPVAALAGTLAMVGLGVFLWLSEARAGQADGDALPALAASTAPAPAPAPETPAARPADLVQSIPNSPPDQSGPVTLVATPGPREFFSGTPTIPTQAPNAGADRERERLRAPALVIDLAQAQIPGTAGETRSDSGTQVIVAPANSSASDRNLSETERFSARVGGEEAEVSSARQLPSLDRLVPQGAIIGAVMETALNSDLPGFARAMTQRDVYSFDGSAVLIPAGSRVIGQYKSGVAQGASRIFILWTRLIRPDGVSIELASPATDDLGRGGLGGKVNRHFLRRYGGAILTSVLSAGLTAATARAQGGSTVIVGGSGQANSLASQAASGDDIPPTITTRQGAPVRIFVARDLDFSGVGPAR
ncbi:MAG: type VI secretion protein [Pseudomonadota bacterium]|nr:type VI secretion protein [Pseudomonadota bacterium]